MAYPVMDTSVPWSLVKSGFHKSPHFENDTQKARTGHRSTLVYRPYPTWDFEVDLNFVSGGEAVQYSVLQLFLGCYIACCGGGGFFLFTDPNDNAVEANPNDDAGQANQSLLLNVTPGAAAPMGTKGDGVSTKFQLARTIGMGVDILQNVVNPLVYVNNVQAAGTVDAKGVMTFTTAPPANASLSWSGNFQYLCQFTEDTLKDLARVSKNSNGFLWSCSSVAFESLFV
jgi:hypothetical protein